MPYIARNCTSVNLAAYVLIHINTFSSQCFQEKISTWVFGKGILMDFYTSIESKKKKKNQYMSIYKFKSYLLEAIIRSESTAKRVYFAYF